MKLNVDSEGSDAEQNDGAVVKNESFFVRWWRHVKMLGIHRATRTIMAILIAYVVLWFPYFVSRLLSIVGSQSPVAVQMIQTVGSMTGNINMALNVFVYNFMNTDFRAAFRRIVYCS